MIQLHYCGQQLESWTVLDNKAGCADDDCGDEQSENDGCCKDEVVVAKVVDEQNAVSQLVLKLIHVPVVLPAQQYFCIDCVELSQVAEFSYDSNAPPGRWQDIPLYKLNSSFTYYG